jgi:hypothetical protein
MSDAVVDPEVIDPVDPVITDPVITDPVVIDPPTPDPAATPEPAALEYTDFTMPEGFVMDPDVLSDYKTAAKELGLEQDKAQKLIEFGALAQAKALEKTGHAWAEQSLTDKEFGGDKLQENLAIASKARDAFATPELIALLNTTRLGNHPEMIRAFYKIGKAMSEDTVVSGGRAPSTAQTAAEKLYN